jgi:hypothetical protein
LDGTLALGVRFIITDESVPIRKDVGGGDEHTDEPPTTPWDYNTSLLIYGQAFLI